MGYLIHVDLHIPLLLSCVFKLFLTIRALEVVIEGIIDYSPTLFFESLDLTFT
jgi:hypothetical protein